MHFRGVKVDELYVNYTSNMVFFVDCKGNPIGSIDIHSITDDIYNQIQEFINGGHRRSGAKAHSNTSKAAHHSPRRTAPRPSTSADQPNPKEIPHAGIRAGEIVAFRSWRILYHDKHHTPVIAASYLFEDAPLPPKEFTYMVDPGFKLHSTYMDTEWVPRVTMTGRPHKDEGVFAFKSQIDLVDYVYAVSQSYAQHSPSIHPAANPFQELHFAIGRIALWGEVVEHTRGYRAENGKIVDIETIYPPIPRYAPVNQNDLLHRLRKDYL